MINSISMWIWIRMLKIVPCYTGDLIWFLSSSLLLLSDFVFVFVFFVLANGKQQHNNRTVHKSSLLFIFIYANRLTTGWHAAELMLPPFDCVVSIVKHNHHVSVYTVCWVAKRFLLSPVKTNIYIVLCFAGVLLVFRFEFKPKNQLM